MQIEIRVQGGVRRGHVQMARRLEALPATVSLVSVASTADRAPQHVMRFERALHRLGDDAHLAAPVSAIERAAIATMADRLVVDLTDDRREGWYAAFDGRPGEEALLDALGQGRLPLVDICDESGRVVVSGRPGSEQPGVVATAYADALAGLATLLLAALQGRSLAQPAPDLLTPSDGAARRPLPLTLARKTAGAAARLAYRTLYRAPHWRVGWRFVEPGEPDVLDTLAHPATGWRDLADDGHHFYADPFPLVHRDETWLFVEDFDHRVGRGVISVVGFDDDGPVGTPRTVLEHDAHLSYPHVFEHDGEVWMVPETSAAGTVELYRATSFPDRWTREAVLLDGVAASDATLFEHGGRWWMLATVRYGGSFSDTLRAWSADRLTGPWSPHALDPLLVDIASARPAGRVVSRDGRLLRPVQDNRTGYGSSLLLTEITALDDAAFDQRVLASLSASPQWPGRRLHTLNRAGRLEVIDGSAMSPRLRRTRR
ncbi:MAG: glucosamine inositolphosphorylceramide transferase family protein [Actinomycetota bacterium]